MIGFLGKIRNDNFLKNVSSLAIGTVLSQLIVISASPILTRLYSVEAFGLLSLFTSCMVIYGVFTTGRYEFALGLPERDDKAVILLKLIVIIGALTSIFALCIIIFLREIICFTEMSGLLETKWIYLAPIYSFLISLYTGLLYWNQRGKHYRRITIANAIQVIVTTIFSLFFGYFFFFEFGLLVSLVLGVFFSSFYLILKFKIVKPQFIYSEIKDIAKEFVSFPRYMILSDLSLTLSQQFTPIIFSSLYSTMIVGYYSLANRMIRLPNIIITSSIASVFRNEAIDEIRLHGQCKLLYISTVKKLIVMSVPIYLLVFLMSPILFSLFFGENWLIAGKIARILSIVLMFEFIVIPLNSIFTIRNKQNIYSRIQFVNMIFGISALYFGYFFFNDFYISLISFSISNIVFNIILFHFSFKYSK